MKEAVLTGMKRSDFCIGGACESSTGKRWRCTDIGTRVIVAVCLDNQPDDDSWYNGPPYAVVEQVFDADSQGDCTPLYTSQVQWSVC